MPMTEGTAKDARLRTTPRMNAARMAGRSTGRVTRTSVRQVPAPNTRDDSSSATSNEAIAGAMMRYAIGRSSSPSTRIMPHSE